MTVLKASALEGFLRRRDSAIGAILIYGDDHVAVNDLARKAVLQIAGSLDDPFCVTPLEEDSLSGDPGRLTDEVLSLSFSGGPRVVWMRSAGQNFQKAIEPVLEGSVQGNLIIAEAGSLPKSSNLRGKFEASDHAAIVPVFEADDESLAEMIEALLHRAGLRIDDDARLRLIELVGRGGLTLQRELEKLAVYCHGETIVGLQQVEAICGDGLWAETADLADAVCGGDMEDADRCFMQLVTSGVDPGRLLSAVHGHAVRLMELRVSMDRGMSIEQAIRSARPPIFFKRQPVLRSQIAIWGSESLLSAAASLQAAVLQERLNAGLSETLANRALLAVARMARSLRVRRN